MDDFLSDGTSLTHAMHSLSSSHHDDARVEQSQGSNPLEAVTSIKLKKKKSNKVDTMEPLPSSKLKQAPKPTLLQQSQGLPHTEMPEQSYTKLSNAFMEQEQCNQNEIVCGFANNEHANSIDIQSQGSRESRGSKSDDLIRFLMADGAYRRPEYTSSRVETRSRTPPVRDSFSIPRSRYSGSQYSGSQCNASQQSWSRHSGGSQRSRDYVELSEADNHRSEEYNVGRPLIRTYHHQQTLNLPSGAPQAADISTFDYDNVVEFEDDSSIHSDITGLTGAFATIVMQESDSLSDEQADVAPLTYPKYDPAMSKFAMMKAMNKTDVAASYRKLKNDRPTVRFGTVQIRSFNRILGDNPSTTSGAPISIGWKYKQYRPLPVNEYEGRRGPTRPSQLLVLNRDTREGMLLALGYSKWEIATAVRCNLKCRNKRRQTVQNLRAEVVEETMEYAVKGVMRLFGRKKEMS